MTLSVFAELQFWLLVILSLVVPAAIHAVLYLARAISPITVLLLGLVLVLMSGADLYLLQYLIRTARATASLADDAVFLSELSVGLYVLPALFAGVGINVISHVLIRHLGEAERAFERQHPDR